MNPLAQIQNHLHFHDLEPDPGDLTSEILEGLVATPKRLAPKFFYDLRGSKLFERITQLPEYYPTRTEVRLYEEFGSEMAGEIGRGAVVLELGSGNATKIRLLLEDLQPRAYVSIDISRDFLVESGEALVEAYPWLQVHLICSDYTRPWTLPEEVPGGRVVAFYPGSTIGNFEPARAVDFLRNLASVLGPGGELLIGVDLQKDPQVLHDAYNDAAGVTAEFNRNILESVNRLAPANFDPRDFRHVALYNSAEHRIEMHLEARRDHQVQVSDRLMSFVRGERIHTESSYKYSISSFEGLASRAGFESIRVWTDSRRYFSVHLLQVTGYAEEAV